MAGQPSESLRLYVATGKMQKDRSLVSSTILGHGSDEIGMSTPAIH